ncbi:unnamed protein product, partial [Phaeothamnion confervicola]
VKAGHLWKRSNNVRKDWKRRYFFIQSGRLYYQRHEVAVSPPVSVCDIKLCTVRECDKDADLRFCFEIISPKQRTYMLQAEDDASRQSWVEAIRQEIEHLLCTAGSRRGSVAGAGASGGDSSVSPGASFHGGSRHGGGGGGGPSGPVGPHVATNIPVACLVRLCKANPTCVDCGAPAPEWASINLGVLMCIECSGIHRSMGVHVSKVRSLTLDRWTGVLLQLMERLGNRKANAVWEGAVPPEAETAAGGGSGGPVDRATREAWIRDKYVRRRFLAPAFGSEIAAAAAARGDVVAATVAAAARREEASRQMFDAALSGDVERVLFCLAHGADVNWANNAEAGATAAHQAARSGQTLVLELLSQNGANLDAVDMTEQAPLDIAMH